MTATVLIVHIQRKPRDCELRISFGSHLSWPLRTAFIEQCKKKARVCNKTGNFFHVFIRLLNHTMECTQCFEELFAQLANFTLVRVFICYFFNNKNVELMRFYLFLCVNLC